VTAVFTTQIEIDGGGVAWLGGTRVKVTAIVLDKVAHGWNPEEIQFQHPHFSLAQIHGALMYYYENKPSPIHRSSANWTRPASFHSKLPIRNSAESSSDWNTRFEGIEHPPIA